jgi:hypothetical protein
MSVNPLGAIWKETGCRNPDAEAWQKKGKTGNGPVEKAEWNQSLEQLRAKLDDAQVEKMDLDVPWPGCCRAG